MERPNNSGIAIIDYIEKIGNGTEQLNVLDTIALKINGTTVTKTAAQINAMGDPDKVTTATPINAIAAFGTLVISGVVKNGETAIVGTETFEFNTKKDALGALIPSGNIDVDLTAAATLKYSQGTLTLPTQPTSGIDTMTIGTKVYTFVPDGTANADGEISVGTDLASAKVNIVAAINGTDGFNVPHTLVWAATFAANDCVITSFAGGVVGNAIATTETFDAVGNLFDGIVLGTTTAGVDAINTEGGTAFETAVNAESTLFTAVDTAGSVKITYKTKGVIGNGVSTTDTMATGAFAAATTDGGVDGTVGEQWQMRVDASYLYIATAANTIADANWRRVSLGSAY